MALMIHFLKQLVDCIEYCFSQLDNFVVVLDSFVWWLYCTLGQCIRDVRIVSGHTQESIAELLDVDVRTIQRWEADQQVPRMRMLCQLQKLYNAFEQNSLIMKEFDRCLEMHYETYFANHISKNVK